jgi:glycosyltransferase involved in cell wall biosynthesis
MHILLIHQAFAVLDEPGGTRHYELARGLVAHGHRVTVIASPVSYLTGSVTDQSRTASTTEDGITILRTYATRAIHRSFVHRMIGFISFMLSSFWAGLHVHQVDLVWGTSPPIFQGLTALLLARLKRVPFLFEVRDLWPAFALQVGVLRNPLLIRLSEWLERFLYRNADQMMVNSPGFIEHVQANGAQRVALVPNGADTRMFDPLADGHEFRQQHQLGEQFIMLYAGAHGMSNDLGVVLEAAHLLRDDPGICFVLLGDGKEKPNLQERAALLKLPNLRFVPSIPKTQMPQALAAADACLAILKPIPLYATVYPNKVFDYMAAGRPVLMAIDGVARQVVEQAEAGVFCPPGDPAQLAAVVLELAANPQRARRLGANGRRYVENHFDRLKLADQLAKLIESLGKSL